jgi:hypothetical protein
MLAFYADPIPLARRAETSKPLGSHDAPHKAEASELICETRMM